MELSAALHAMASEDAARDEKRLAGEAQGYPSVEVLAASRRGDER